MSLPTHLLVQSVTKVRPAIPAADARGNIIPDYGVAATRTTVEVWLQQDTRIESFPDGRNPQEQLWLLMSNDSDWRTGDRVEWGAITFEVHGPPEPAYDATGFHHTEATLRVLGG